MASPMPPKRRPSPPVKSRKPRCSRAGTDTVTLSLMGVERLTGAPFFARRVFRTGKTGLDWTNPRWQRGLFSKSTLMGGHRMNEQSKERTYSDTEVKARLKQDLPHWYLEGGWIRRRYRTHSWKGTLMVINAVGHLAEAAWHHPDITASYAWVEVRLQNHAAKGIT